MCHRSQIFLDYQLSHVIFVILMLLDALIKFVNYSRGHLLDILFSVSSHFGTATKPSGDMGSALHKETLGTIKKIRKLCRVASISYGVLHNGEIVLQHGIGFREARSRQKPDENTMYLLISVSKTIVAAAMGILVEQRKLDWSDLISKHIENFHPRANTKVAEISTVLDLLRHTSGLKNPVVSILGPNGVIIPNEEDFMRIINETPIAAPNGDTYDFEYSNVGFGLAAKVIEKASEMLFSTFVQENILDPLKMTRTACTKHTVRSDRNLAAPYVWDGLKSFKALRCDWTDEERPSILGSLGFRSSVKDMLVWSAATMSAEHDHNFDGSGILRDRSNPLKQMDIIRSAWVDFSTREGDLEQPGYCLGWFRAVMPTSRLGWGSYNEMTQDDAGCVESKDILGRELENGKTVIKHTGIGAGAAVSLWTFPETRSAVIVLSNGLNLGDASDFTAQVLTQALFDLEPKVDILDQARREKHKRSKHFDNTILGLWKKHSNLTVLDSRDMEEYVGEYRGLGITLYVKVEQGQLFVEFNGKKEAMFALSYYNKNQYSFLPQNRDQWLTEGWLDWDYYTVGVLEFVETDGVISGLLWTWEEGLEPPSFFQKISLN